MFTNLQTYARCACNTLYEYDEELGRNSSWKYFAELTEMVEGIFQEFRGNATQKENCPPWQFSCNAEGEAILDVYEIVCPLELDDDQNDDESVLELKEEIEKGVRALTDNQVIIDTTDNILTVLMYSEGDAIVAVEWLALNSSADTSPEIVSVECTLNDEIVEANLNDIYGDFTPAPTDGCHNRNPWFLVMISCIIAFLFVFG